MEFLNSPIIEVAISLIVTWALFAILCSFAHELIAETLAERGRYLKRKLLAQLQDKPNGVNWASPLYIHGSIDLLSRAENKPSSVIPGKLFAETIVEVIANAQIVQHHIQRTPQDDDSDESQMHKAFLQAYQTSPYKNQTLKNFKAATQVLKPSDVLSLFQQSLNSAEIRAGVSSQDPRTQAQCEANVYNYLIENICSWYDSFTERINIWYKKTTRRRLMGMGFVLAFVLHVDTIQLFNHFKAQPASRQELITYFEQNSARLEEKYIQGSRDTLQDNLAGLLSLQREFKKEMDSINVALALPIGWDSVVIDEENKFTSWTLKIVGFILTAFAASFGAPFWFDLFKRATKANVTKP